MASHGDSNKTQALQLGTQSPPVVLALVIIRNHPVSWICVLPVSPPLESAFHEHRNLVLVIDVALESISNAKNPAFIL